MEESIAWKIPLSKREDGSRKEIDFAKPV